MNPTIMLTTHVVYDFHGVPRRAVVECRPERRNDVIRAVDRASCTTPPLGWFVCAGHIDVWAVAHTTTTVVAGLSRDHLPLAM